MKIKLFIFFLAICGQTSAQNITAYFVADTVCFGDTTHFYDLSTSSPYSISDWTWDFGDGTNSFLQNPYHSYQASGTYSISLIVGNIIGDKDTAYASINVYPLPTVFCSANPDTIIFGNFTLLNSSSPTGQLFNWTPGVGLNSTAIPNPVASPIVSVCYRVTVTDSNGCSDTCSICVVVVPATSIDEHEINNHFEFLPNPFSSLTTLQTYKDFKNATLTVYNLYGQTVKQKDNLSGQTITFYRDNLPSGLYLFKLTQDNKIILTDKLIITDN